MIESKQLLDDSIINQVKYDELNTYENTKPMSLHWELRTILYLGVLLLTSGIGILIYQNIDTIGHQAILGAILLSTIGCFYYVFKNRLPYSHEALKHSSPFFDYILLLGNLLFGIFIGYLQFQYSVFGLHYGFATILPTIVLLCCAYYFDHKGLLSLGISGLSASLGFTVTPKELLTNNDFYDLNLIITAIALGVLLLAVGYLSEIKNIKKHFSFTFNQFAINILCITLLATLFQYNLKIIYLLSLIAICYYYFKYAVSKQSFLFLLLSIIYSYIGLTYIIFKTMIDVNMDEAVVFLGFFYFFGSCAGIVLFFLFYKRILKLK